MKKSKCFILFTVIVSFVFFTVTAKEITLTPKEQLGKKLFFDVNLSTPPGQSCATCHGSEAGWTGPDSHINEETAVYPGALKPRFGNRKPPTAAYAGMSPELHRDEDGTFTGGMFWDGRASGWEIGDPLAEQAMGPFLNPLEQNIADKQRVVKKVLASDYVALFKKVWGPDSLSLEDIDGAYERIARSIAAYERSEEVNPFSSRFDDFWRKAKAAGLNVEDIDEKNVKQYRGLGLNEKELQGLMLFNTKGLCAECHVLTSVDGAPPLFTDFTYDNLGVPKNPNNPFYKQDKEFNPEGTKWVDRGLGDFLQGTEKYKKYAAENMGKQKVPTLRNVDLRPAKDFVKVFMHNGFFKTLKEVVNFYNTRDKPGAKWPEPEIKVNVNTEELGDLGLTPEEEDAIVFFMQTLSDRVKGKLWKEVQKIHEDAIVIDAHAHPMMYLNAAPENLDLGKKTGKSQVDFITMKEGGLDAVFYSVPLLNDINKDNPSKKIFDDIVLIRDQVNKYAQLAELALSPSDIKRIHDSGKRAILLGIEYPDVLEGHTVLLAAYYKLGVRLITIAHTKIDRLAGPPWKGGGLSKFGEEVINEMNRLGMLIDITHTADNLQLDIIKKSKAPVIASHSCMRAVHNKPRNIPDNILKEIAKKDGAVMITFYPGHLSRDYQEAKEKYEREKKKTEEKLKDNKTELEIQLKILEEKMSPRPVGIEALIDHIDHAVKTAGIDHVGLGSDFAGTENLVGLETAAGYPIITYHLLKRGYKEEDIKKILGGNLLRVFSGVQKLRFVVDH